MTLDGIPLCQACLAASEARAPLPPRCDDCDTLTEPDCDVAAPQRPMGTFPGPAPHLPPRTPPERPETPPRGLPGQVTGQTPLHRAGHAALRPAPEDPELVRVRTLLASLRPDAPDPMVPPPVERPGPAPLVVPRDGTPPWDRLPQGLFSPMGREVLESRTPGELASEVLRRLADMAPDARAVLRWLRAHAVLAEGLRGLYVDVGMAFADDTQRALWDRDLTARRDGAAPHGRHLVLAAATAWGV